MFEYKIYEEVYDAMFSGKKTIEFRLLNDKTEKIKIGDTIKFNVIDSEKYVLTEVLNKYTFDDIDDLWNHKELLSNNILNYNKEQLENKFYEIFGKDKILKTKIMGIEFKLLDKN